MVFYQKKKWQLIMNWSYTYKIVLDCLVISISRLIIVCHLAGHPIINISTGVFSFFKDRALGDSGFFNIISGDFENGAFFKCRASEFRLFESDAFLGLSFFCRSFGCHFGGSFWTSKSQFSVIRNAILAHNSSK